MRRVVVATVLAVAALLGLTSCAADVQASDLYKIGCPAVDAAAGGGSMVSKVTLAGLKKLKDQGSLKDGMLPKAKAIEDAIRGGVRRVHCISYKSPDSILAEVFTNEGTGTLIVDNIKTLSAAEQGAGA